MFCIQQKNSLVVQLYSIPSFQRPRILRQGSSVLKDRGQGGTVAVSVPSITLSSEQELTITLGMSYMNRSHSSNHYNWVNLKKQRFHQKMKFSWPIMFTTCRNHYNWVNPILAKLRELHRWPRKVRFSIQI